MTPAAVLNLYDKLMDWAKDNEKKGNKEIAYAYRYAATAMWVELDLANLIKDMQAARVVQ